MSDAPELTASFKVDETILMTGASSFTATASSNFTVRVPPEALPPVRAAPKPCTAVCTVAENGEYLRATSSKSDGVITYTPSDTRLRFAINRNASCAFTSSGCTIPTTSISPVRDKGAAL